jgi:hypothetical protein
LWDASWRCFLLGQDYPLYINERFTADWKIKLQSPKNTSSTPFAITLYPCCLSCLSIRFDGVLGGLADPRTTSLCPSPTGLPGRCSWVYQANNRRRIGMIGSLVGLTDLLHSCYDLGYVRPQAW